MDPYISARNITISLNKKIIVEQLSFDIKKGDKVAIVGASGKGKTTILNALLGFTQISKGEIIINGLQCNAKNIDSIRKLTAWLPQDIPNTKLSVRDLMLTPFDFEANKKRSPAESVINDVLQNLLLSETILKQQSNEISGGQRQRILLACSLLLHKEILIADEPTSALDETTKQQITNYVFSNKTQTIIAATHDAYWISKSNKIIEL